MSNTYTQLHIHFVFAVKNRQSLVHEPIRVRLEKYITGIVQNFGHKVLSVFCMPDHTHLLVGLRPTQAIADLMREVKSSATLFINEQKLTREKFGWQEGYGAFSYSHSHLQDVIDYILNQPTHHQKKTFREEYLAFLRKFDIAYEEKYLFNWIEPGATPMESE
jgi:REP element-mobilizing transposase RayT